LVWIEGRRRDFANFLQSNETTLIRTECQREMGWEEKETEEQVCNFVHSPSSSDEK
jgi:hypothetical protein